MAHSYTVTVEVDADPVQTGLFVLDTSALDGTDVLGEAERWAAIPAGDVYEVGIRRGRSDDSREYDAGECVVTLDNRSGDYDPDNSDSPYVVGGIRLLKSGTGLRVKVEPAAGGGTVTTLFSGRIEAFDLDHDPIAPTAAIACSDLLADLGRTPMPPLPAAVGEGDTTADRAARMLDAAAVPSASRDVGGALVVLPWEGGGTARSQLERLARGEGGRAYVTRDGVFTLSTHADEFTKTTAVAFTDEGA